MLEGINNLPPEVRERIIFFLDSRCQLSLGWKLDPWRIFFDDGIYCILREVLLRGCDLKSLIYLKEKYLKEDDDELVAVAIGIKIRSPFVIKRICCLWDEKELRYDYKVRMFCRITNFRWGIRNLDTTGSRRFRVVMSDITEEKNYQAILALHDIRVMQYHPKKELDILSMEEVIIRSPLEGWIDFPEEYYTYLDTDSIAAIKYIKGDKTQVGSWFRRLLRGDSVDSLYTLFRVVSNNRATIDIFVAAFNEVFDEDTSPNWNWKKVMFLYKALKEDQPLLDILVRLDGMELLLGEVEELIHAIETKNSTLLQERFPTPSNESNLEYFRTFFTTMFMYNYISSREHQLVVRIKMDAFNEAESMSVLVVAEVITQRIEDDIFMTDPHTEVYYRTKSSIKKLGYNYTPIVTSEILGFPVSIREAAIEAVNEGRISIVGDEDDELEEYVAHAHLQAIYEEFGRDPSFLPHIRHPIGTYWRHMSKDCILWLLYSLLRENIPLHKRGRTASTSNLQYNPNPQRLTVSLQEAYHLALNLIQSEGDEEFYISSIFLAWTHLID